jgi:polysaccharide pyruvyl transferase WcaK-like protein
MTSGPIFSNNMGCNALTYGSISVLEDVAKLLNLTFQYYLCGNDQVGVVPSELRDVRIRLSRIVPHFCVINLLKWFLRHELKGRFCDYKSFKSCDLFIDNAFGDSFSDIYGQNRFESVQRNLNFALKLGKPLILFPQTIGPFRDKKIEAQASKLLKKASMVYSRDPLSSKCAKELTSDIDIFETIDVAFFMQYQQREKEADTIGVNPSGLLWRGGYTGKNEFGLVEDYKEVVREIIGQLLDSGKKVVLVGHDIHGPSTGSSCDDYYVCKALQREFPECEIAPFFYSPVEAKSFISGLGGLLGSRMHCCIAAYSSGVPVLPLAYSRKFRGLFTDKLGYSYLSELTNDSSEEVIMKVKNFVSSLDNISAQMPERIEKLDSYKKCLVVDVANRLKGIL